MEEAGGGSGGKTCSSAFEPFITWLTDFNKGLTVEKSTILADLEPKLDFSTNIDQTKSRYNRNKNSTTVSHSKITTRADLQLQKDNNKLNSYGSRERIGVVSKEVDSTATLPQIVNGH